MKNVTKKPPHGFTLVELLVVIAIISVLAALLLPALNNAMESARDVGCRNNMKQLAILQQNYQNDFNNYYLPDLFCPRWESEDPNAHIHTWSWVGMMIYLDYVDVKVCSNRGLSVYPNSTTAKSPAWFNYTLRGENILGCPSGFMFSQTIANWDFGPGVPLPAKSEVALGNEADHCYDITSGADWFGYTPKPDPSIPNGNITLVDYGMNFAFHTNLPKAHANMNKYPAIPIRNLAGASSATILFAEAPMHFSWDKQYNAPLKLEYHTNTAGTLYRSYRFRHFNHVNYTCLDGRVSTLDRDTVLALRYGAITQNDLPFHF